RTRPRERPCLPADLSPTSKACRWTLAHRLRPVQRPGHTYVVPVADLIAAARVPAQRRQALVVHDCADDRDETPNTSGESDQIGELGAPGVLDPVGEQDHLFRVQRLYRALIVSDQDDCA